MRKSLFFSALLWVSPFPLVAQHGQSLDTVTTRWETHLRPMISSGMDVPIDQAVDALGNFYITGKSEGQETGYDYLTVKYNSSGTVQWTARYDGPYHAMDIPNAITVDATGNVFVTGMSIGSDSVYSDFATVKYSSSGIQQWVKRYNGPANGMDVANAIAVDDDGNSYVTGAQTNGWTHDFVTIRYNPQGEEQWVAVYDGPDGWEDEAIALALDPSGYIYVTGTSANTVATYPWVLLDCTTIKYDLSGNVAWVQRFNVSDTADVKPIGVTIDVGGNVCIGANVSFRDPIGRYTNDIVALKYAPDGVLQWARVFDSPAFDESLRDIPDIASGIALDADDNIYVTGASGDVHRDVRVYVSLVTIKYLPDGSRLWARYYAGAGESVRSAGIGVDPTGNVHVAGANGHFDYTWSSGEFVGDSLITLRYDSNGMLQWARHHNGAAGLANAAKGIGLDQGGNIYVVGEYGLHNESDFLALKYSPSGSESWSRVTTGPGNAIAFIADAKLDEQGNIYIAGTGLGTDANQDYMTMKLDPSGGVLWSATYDSPGHFGDYVRALETDASGNVYVTGLSSGGTYGWSSTTIKYSPTGNQEWVARFDSSSMNAIGVDPDGNVFVGGLGVIKYDPNGEHQWHASADFWVTALAVGDSGCIYVTGGPYPADERYLRKLNSEGVELWSRMTPAAGSLAIDDSANVYVSAPGYYPGTGGTVKFTPSGIELWSITEGGNKIKADGSHGVYVHSFSWGPGSLHRIAADGTIEWTQATYSEMPVDFDTDNEGNAYVTTTTFDFGVYTSEILTTKYLPTGDIAWSSSYDSDNASPRAKKVRIDSSQNLYLFMEHEGNDFSAIPVVAKNSQLPAIRSSTDEEGLSPDRFQLYQNYPNPFNPTTAISYQLSAVSFVELKLFDVLGREVRTLVNESLSAGTYRIILDAKGLASGMYFYRLKAGEYVATRKLVLLR